MEFDSVKDRNDENRTEVIDNRQRSKENFKPYRNALAQYRENSDCKCNVSCHGDTPTMDCFRPMVKEEINACRYKHSTKRSKKWKRGFPRGRQLSMGKFLLDFDTDHQKKDSHQAIINPL